MRHARRVTGCYGSHPAASISNAGSTALIRNVVERVASSSVKVWVVVPAAVLAVAVSACGGGSSTQAVHGKVMGGTQAAATVFSAMGGGGGICGGAVEGTQVIVKGPSGTLLATTTLHKDVKATSQLGLTSSLASGQIGIYNFAATIPAGSGPYTIDLVGVNSLVVSAQQLGNLQLTCG
jgi:hypothetical protein